jgi:hypothetical protein
MGGWRKPPRNRGASLVLAAAVFWLLLVFLALFF